MPRSRHFLVLLLAVLWLPATLHCELRAAGADALLSCSADAAATADEAHHRDACDVVESGWIKRAPTDLTVAAPALCACLFCLVCPAAVQLHEPSPLVLSDTIVAPPELARTWQFVARAAPPPRAPASIS